MASRCDIEVVVHLHDDFIVAATCGCDIDILVEVDNPIEIETFDYPPVVDRLKIDIKNIENRVKNLEDNPPAPAIEVDDEVTQEGTNPVSGRGIWGALSALWQEVQDAISAIAIPSKLSDLENDSGFITAGEVPINDSLKVNALGSISGDVQIDLASGTYITATLEDAVSLTFASLPQPGYKKQFILRFTNIHQITYPIGTRFTGGIAPTIIASPCEIYCDIDHLGNLEVKGLIDDINTPTQL